MSTCDQINHTIMLCKAQSSHCVTGQDLLSLVEQRKIFFHVELLLEPPGCIYNNLLQQFGWSNSAVKARPFSVFLVMNSNRKIIACITQIVIATILFGISIVNGAP